MSGLDGLCLEAGSSGGVVVYDGKSAPRVEPAPVAAVVSLEKFREGKERLHPDTQERCVICWTLGDKLALATTTCERCGAGICGPCFVVGCDCYSEAEAADLAARLAAAGKGEA